MTTANTRGAASWFSPSSMFGSSNTAAAQVTNPSTTTGFGQVVTPAIGSTNVLWNFHSNQNTASTQITTPASSTASNGVRWYHPSTPATAGQVASAQVTYPGAAQIYNPYNPVPAPAPQIFVTPAHTTAATVTTVTGPNSFAAQQPGRGTIAAASISGTRGTVNAVVSGAGKAIPFARTTNIASTQISRTSCYGGKMGSCGKMGSSRSRSSVYSYEALASASVAPSVAVAATSAVLLWNVL